VHLVTIVEQPITSSYSASRAGQRLRACIRGVMSVLDSQYTYSAGIGSLHLLLLRFPSEQPLTLSNPTLV
jgi:hypothetical protein